MRLNHNRAGTLLSIFGLTMLSASLYTWTWSSYENKILYTVDEYEWVDAELSTSAAVDSDEIWRFEADCARPIIQLAMEKLKREQKDHLGRKPLEVKQYESLPPLKKLDDTTEYYLAKANRDSHYIAVLSESQAWFFHKSTLDEKVKSAQNVLDRLKDAMHLKSELTRSMLGHANVLSRFGVDGVGSEVIEQSYHCIRSVPINKVVNKTSYRSELPRWPAEQPWLFWPSLMLAVIGLFFRPLLNWVWVK